MAETEVNPIPETVKPNEGTIRGEVLIGLTHPKNMTSEQFEQPVGLLFHGTGRDFIYSNSGEFDRDQVVGDGSTDYGSGFYTTDSKKQAESYSITRSGNKTDKPIVYSFRPYNARMLDVRDINNPENNGVLPDEFVREWTTFLEAYSQDESNFRFANEFIKDAIRTGIKEEFIEPSKRNLESGKPFTIRAGNFKEAGIFKRNSNGLIDIAFQRFMVSKGYDGMIYREGGEGPYADNLTGYIFYNPQAVDTHEGWQKRK